MAHDNRKPALADWGQTNAAQLEGLTLISTGTTGGLIAESGSWVRELRVNSHPGP